VSCIHQHDNISMSLLNDLEMQKVYANTCVLLADVCSQCMPIISCNTHCQSAPPAYSDTVIQAHESQAHESQAHESQAHGEFAYRLFHDAFLCVCVCGRHHGDPAVWAPLCDAWDRALQMLSRARGVTPLSFRTLMEGHVAHQLLKPVRARWQLFMQCDSDMYMCTFMQVQVDNNNLTYLCIYIPTQHVHKCLLSMFHNKMQLAAHSRYFFWRHVCY